MSDSKQTNQSTGNNPAADDQYTAGTIEPDDVAATQDGGLDTTGQLIETFISMRYFASVEWILANVASQPAGTHLVVGRIAGMATTGETRESGLKVKSGEKAPPPSFWAKGQFEATALQTGEIKTAPWLILPRAAGELLSEAFANGAQRAMLDLEIGLQATGKALPYRWTVRAYGGRQSEAQRVIAAIRSRQEARADARQPARIAAPGPVDGPLLMDGAKARTTV